MKTLTKSFFSAAMAASLMVLAACAKERPIETKKDPDGQNIPKSAFLGSPSASLSQDGVQTGGKVWNQKVTVVATSTNGGFAFVGFQSDNRLGYFEFTKERLKFYDAVSLYRPGGAALPELINEWNVSHYDVKLGESDGNITNKEVEDSDKAWNQKRFFKVDFSKANISENATFPGVYWSAMSGCWQPRGSHLVDGSLQMESDHLTFTVAVDYEQSSACADLRRSSQGDHTYTVHYKYSFWERKETDYKPLVYTGPNDPEMKKYGFFQTVIERKNAETNLPEAIVVKNRWNPNRDFVDFYFTPGFPESYKWMFNDPKIGVIAQTNKVFEKAGVKMRFRIWENEDGPGALKGKVKAFGDGRFSFINFVEEIDPSAPLGYGPSDADPLTGEIMSANTIIWTGYLNYYLKVLSTQNEHIANQTENSTLFAHMKTLLSKDKGDDGQELGADVSRWTNTWSLASGHGKAYHDILPEVTFGYPGWARFSAREATEMAAPQQYQGKDLSGTTSLFHSLGLGQLFNFTSTSSIAHWGLTGRYSIPQAPAMIDRLSSATRAAMQGLAEVNSMASNKRNSQVYPIDPVLSQLPAQLNGTKEGQHILNSILYRTAIHEFGHNLGLRHNFYGSIDKENHGEFDHDHNPVPKGSASAKYKSETASVMEYMGLQQELDLAYNWEAYDVAALSYAYSDRKVKSDRKFLYCTDEHTILNALCNRFDYGTTPSEIAMSMIKNYDLGYWTRNQRFDRAYWNTRGYESSVFSTMYTMKKFLPLYFVALDENTIRQELNKDGVITEDEEIYIKKITDDVKQAVKLSIAFYDAVIQQKASERPYTSEVELFSGEMKRIGIIYDKIYAMMFLMGNDSFAYHPNQPLSSIGFMTVKGQPEFRPLLDKVYENTVTQRVDMEPWFINYGRLLYAVTSVDPYNGRNIGHINKLKVVRYTADEMKKNFGINVREDATNGVPGQLLSLTKSLDPEFKAEEQVGYSEVNGLYYLASAEKSPYAYRIVETIVKSAEDERSVVQAKDDLKELYHLYLAARQDTR